MYGYEKGQPLPEEQNAMPPEQAEPGAAPPMEAEDPQAQLEQIAQSAPAPTKPFSVKALKMLLDTFNKALSKISAVEMPTIEIDFEGEEKGKWNQPLPGELFLPLMAVSELVKMVSGGEFESKYSFDPFTMLTDTDVRKVAALLKMMAKDKKFMDAVKELQEGAPGEAPEESPEEQEESPDMAPAPGEMGEEDQMLAAEMQ